MPRLLLLLPSSTYRGEAFLEAAAKLEIDVTLGLERTVVLLHRPECEWLSLNFSEPERSASAVVEYAQGQPIHAVLGVDDVTAVLAAQFAEALDLPHNSVESVSAARNKHHMRKLLHARGVPVPRFAPVSIFDDPAALAGTVPYPCVVKPLILSASCGVIRADNPDEFVTAFRRVAALLQKLGITATGEAGRQLLVETFIPGREVALEGLLTGGSLRVLAFFDKPDPLDGPFFEETIYVTPSRLPMAIQRDIAVCAEHAARALRLREGPIHGEFRVNEQGVWAIEIAARSIGGRCSRTLHFAAGISLEELILRHAFRMELPPLEREAGAAGVMMLPIPRAGVFREMRGEAEALAVPGIEEVIITAEPGQTLLPLPEGTRYLGFMIARAAAPADVEAALRLAHGRLAFVTDELNDGQSRDKNEQASRVHSIRF
ncbi:MAG TPA: ATP-grasp domain-containing protein [Nitrospiraceae bacterium]|nr:ATP-grasp domain-containing protein [Nitrospiraceae bacterium]